MVEILHCLAYQCVKHVAYDMARDLVLWGIHFALEQVLVATLKQKGTWRLP